MILTLKDHQGYILEFVFHHHIRIHYLEPQLNSDYRGELLNNLMYVYKTKGTTEAIQSLLNLYGFDSTGFKMHEYGGSTAEKHTNKMVSNMRAMGISVLSYFIGGSYDRDDMPAFTKMYGKDAEFINATNMMQVAKTMNKKFLEK